MIETVTLPLGVVRLLRGYIDCPFDMPTLSSSAATMGTCNKMSDKWLAVFDLPEGIVLQLAAADDEGTRVGCAIVPLCNWDPGVGASMRDHPERAAYDAYFDQALSVIVSELGPPDHNGADRVHFPYRWSVWLGATGLLALQQSHYDYSPDVSLWARPHPGTGFAPQEPFADWLMSTPDGRT